MSSTIVSGKMGLYQKYYLVVMRVNRDTTIKNLKKNGYSDSEILEIEKEYAKIFKEGAKKFKSVTVDIPGNFGGVGYKLGIGDSEIAGATDVPKGFKNGVSSDWDDYQAHAKYVEDQMKKNINSSFTEKFSSLWWLADEQAKSQLPQGHDQYKKNLADLINYFDAKPITVNDLKKLWKMQDFWSRVMAVPNEALYEFIIKEYNKEIQKIKDQTVRFKK